MKLYMHPVSTTSRPVMMLAAMAKLPLETQVVDLATGEHHGEEYAAKNPNRQVPMLDDDGFVLTESSAIVKYLADKAESPLYPRDLRARARVNERMDWFNTNFYREYGYHLVYPQVYPHHGRGSDEATRATAEWGKGKSEFVLQVLNDWVLGDNKFVCGDEMTIADVFGAQLVSTGELVGAKLDAYPNVQRWMAEMKALPEWKQTNEIHDGFAASMADRKFITI